MSTFFHDITMMSENGLLALHRSTRDRLAEEDALPPNSQKVYFVREFPDWKLQADEIENELDRRKVSYQKIAW